MADFKLIGNPAADMIRFKMWRQSEDKKFNNWLKATGNDWLTDQAKFEDRMEGYKQELNRCKN